MSNSFKSWFGLPFCWFSDEWRSNQSMLGKVSIKKTLKVMEFSIQILPPTRPLWWKNWYLHLLKCFEQESRDFCPDPPKNETSTILEQEFRRFIDQLWLIFVFVYTFFDYTSVVYCYTVYLLDKCVQISCFVVLIIGVT